MRSNLPQLENSVKKNCQSNSVFLNSVIGNSSNIFQTIFQEALDLIFILNPIGKVQIINKTALGFSNCNEKDIIGKYIWDTPFWNKCTIKKSNIKDSIENNLHGENGHVETKFISENNKIHYIDFSFKPIYDENNEIIMIIQEGKDVTYRKDTENYLQEIATHDSLTGLPNERLLYDRLNQAILRTRRNNSLTGVMFIDLDGFKGINDKYGHSVGDLILQAVSIRIMDNIRENDTVARIGGDEFVVILEDVKELHHIITVTERLLSSIEKPFKSEDINCSSLTASIGISIFPYDGTDAEMLLKKADYAMYQVKNENKNDYKIFI